MMSLISLNKSWEHTQNSFFEMIREVPQSTAVYFSEQKQVHRVALE